jgi:hypothetical protein
MWRHQRKRATAKQQRQHQQRRLSPRQHKNPFDHAPGSDGSAASSATFDGAIRLLQPHHDRNAKGALR